MIPSTARVTPEHDHGIHPIIAGSKTVGWTSHFGIRPPVIVNITFIPDKSDHNFADQMLQFTNYNSRNPIANNIPSV